MRALPGLRLEIQNASVQVTPDLFLPRRKKKKIT